MQEAFGRCCSVALALHNKAPSRWTDHLASLQSFQVKGYPTIKPLGEVALYTLLVTIRDPTLLDGAFMCFLRYGDPGDLKEPHFLV